jgi:hypothetical protein
MGSVLILLITSMLLRNEHEITGFNCSSGYANLPLYYVIGAVPVLFILMLLVNVWPLMASFFTSIRLQMSESGKLME